MIHCRAFIAWLHSEETVRVFKLNKKEETGPAAQVAFDFPKVKLMTSCVDAACSVADLTDCYTQHSDRVLAFGGVNLVQNVGDVLCRGVGDRSPPMGSRGEAPVEGLEDKVPQKPKQFWITICIILTEF